MSQVTETPTAPDDRGAANLEKSTYEIIRQRLNDGGSELRTRLAKLDAARRDVFGSIPNQLLATQRITTANNCVARDIVSIGDRFLFGYNVRLGLRSETVPADVFSVWRLVDGQFVEESLAPIEDARFQEDFRQLYKYYKTTTFSRFFRNGPHLFMVFQVGKTAEDIKTFKWTLHGEKLVYLDNRSDHEVRYPPQHEFEWKRTVREQHRSGKFPHVSIEDRVFVETVGGDLTIKIEDNTESGSGIYSEPVEDRDQSLDDAEIHYAIVGNLVLLRIRPYKEKGYRHLIYNSKVQSAVRVDSLADAAVLLPEGHGLIFPNGYYLQTGEFKTFESTVGKLLFERRIASPNGEDHLYAFYDREKADYVLLPYNMIRQQVDVPILCNGWSNFEDGRMLLFRADAEPQKHHAIQIWQTPFVGPDHPTSGDPNSFLYKIGNRDIVRAMSEAYEVLSLVDKDDSYANLYVDLVRKTTDLTDSYFWLDDAEASKVGEAVRRIRDAASSAIEEFDKVVRVRKNTRERFAATETSVRETITAAAARMYRSIDDFVASLAALRKGRGESIALRDLKYVDLAAVDALEKQVAENSERISRRCVEFLLRPDSLQPYEQRVATQRDRIDKVPTVAEADKLGAELDGSASELEMLIDIVGNLKIDDATQRTRIVDGISSIYSKLNQARAALRKRTQALRGDEGSAEFHAQMKLLSQATSNYLDVADSPQRCDEYLTKMMVQVEELEGRFAEFDQFVLQLAEKREEIYAAFDARRLALVEARNRRATALQQAADRILKGISTRVAAIDTPEEIHAYFASDLMIEKIRDLCAKLAELEDSVKVDEIQGRLKAVREDAIRQLRDRKELFEEGTNVIRLGKHRFSVNLQQLELTTVLKEDRQWYHLTGTAFQEAIADPRLEASRAFWQQEIVSENASVYRAEYLAWLVHRAGDPLPGETAGLLDLEFDGRVAAIQRFMAPRYAEGYVKGVHDHDAALIVSALRDIDRQIGHLRYPTAARTAARLFWTAGLNDDRRRRWMARIRGAATVRQLFPKGPTEDDQLERLAVEIAEFVERESLFETRIARGAAGFLFEQLGVADRLAVHAHAGQLLRGFRAQLERRGQHETLVASLAAFDDDVAGRFRMARRWLAGYVAEFGPPEEAEWVDEVAAALLGDGDPPILHGETRRTIEGLLGSHPRLEAGPYVLDYHEFVARVERFRTETVPGFEGYQALKKELLESKRHEMRLEEFRPRVLTSFVRNKLIDEVYLPLIGDNLAKQMGAVGDAKRTDLMGLLLLISPPGYGKTTLMEYVANRLGLTFMKINGPAIGHQVTSLDPAEAPNASAREEVEKLNLALEMGDNVMIYLDDIQHCNPELLQKFISLCDGSRRIEGVYRGRTRTYDLRGRKVCVVMAGNPYTESGSKFRIPDMLANRADTYNLGDVVGEHAHAFERSYLENALSSNPALQLLQSRSRADLDTFLKMAEDRAPEGYALEGNYAADEIAEIVSVLRKLLRVRDVLLKVNALYIASAAQADEYRTEPPFKMQGSYRDMNKLAERIVAVMNDAELDTALMSHFENQAQTLTTGAEANLLKFRELMGWLTPEERERWDEIRRTFQRNLLLGGAGSDDRVGQVIAQLTVLGEGLVGIRKALDSSAKLLTQTERETHPDKSLLDPERQAAHHLASGVQVLGGFGGQLDAIRVALEALVAANERPRPVVVEGLPATFPNAAATPSPAASAHATAEDESDDPSARFVGLQPVGAPTPAAPTPPPWSVPPSIEIVNKIPRQFLDVIKAQFTVLQSWWEPLMRATEMRGAEAESLRTALQTSMARYDELLRKIDGKR
ncbi:MAG TPA: DNA repair ATPase [Pirellulaceae bacterium]|nr:DNA repair ATPase [Pirellulaceae bacterium]